MIGKGKASAPYEFGVKVSIVTTNVCAPGGQFVLHAKALYDGHTLANVIDATEHLTGCAISTRVIAATTRPNRGASLSRGRNAASSAPSNASSGADRPSEP
jgi:transposase, IS5 family